MTIKKNIFYVEDDESLAYVTKDNLERCGYIISHFDNGQLGLNNFRSIKFDLCVIDVMLPKMDGFELAKHIRSMDQNIPILFLSARTSDEDRIKGLKIGADDYITKPFSMEELCLKIDIFIKRNKIYIDEEKDNILIINNSNLDIYNQQLNINSINYKLTERETNLLQLFFESPNKIIKRDDILQKIWGNNSYFNGRSLDVFLSKIRKYLIYDSKLKIENIHGIGFRLITDFSE